MKNIYITISGEGNIYSLENLNDKDNYNMVPIDIHYTDLEEDGWLDGDLFECPFILTDLKVSLSTDDGEEIDITKQKGKYINNKTYFKDLGFEPPFFVISVEGTELYETYTIELSDDEEFDPMKLQLVKSDYELDFLPYGIVLGYIMYDGKKIYGECLGGGCGHEEQFIYVSK